MPRSFLLMPIAVALLAGCGSPPPQPAAPVAPVAVVQQSCDDGGSGGVLIDGVCL